MKFIVSRDQNNAVAITGSERINVVAASFNRDATGSTCDLCVFHHVQIPEDKPCYHGPDVSQCAGHYRTDQRVIVWWRKV